MYLDPTFQSVIGYGLAFVWAGTGIVLAIRFRAKQRAYLRKHPPVDRYLTLDMVTSAWGNPPGTYGRLKAALHQPQSDLEMEQMRLEMWRYYRFYILWVFGFPLLVISVAALLIVPGWVRLH